MVASRAAKGFTARRDHSPGAGLGLVVARVGRQNLGPGRSRLALLLLAFDHQTERLLQYDEFLFKNTGERQIAEFDRFVQLCLEDHFTVVDFRTFLDIFPGEKRG